MSTELEFEGRSIDEAVERAAGTLGREPDQLVYEVLDDGKKGFLGIGSRMARIRVRKDEASPSVPARGPASADARGGAGQARPRRSAGAARDREHPLVQPPTSAGPTLWPGQADAAPYSRHEALRSVAGRILREMKLDLAAKLRDRDDSIVLELGGHDAHLLIENDGEGLDAIQQILNKIMGRDPRFGKRVVADCEGFRSRRDAELVERAARLAAEALNTGKPAHLDGLNPYERRLVHLSLAEEPRVRTHSSGEGSTKRLTIEPREATTSAEEA